MKVKSIGISFLGIITIFIVMLGAISPSSMQSVYAQDLSTETSTPDPFLLETPYPPIGTDTFPPVIPTETNTITSTPLPENPTQAQTPEPTYTETQLPTEALVIPTGDFHWKVSIEVPIQSADLQSFGGVSGAETHLENTLQSEITDQGVAFDVNTTRITNTSATYVVELEGTGGIDQFVQTIYSDLNEQLNLLNGPIQLRITGYIQSGQIIPVILESNITTGYLWELVNFDTSMLEKQGKPLFEQKMSGIGAPSKEMITFRAIADGMTTITINYRQPFDRGERQTRFIDLTDGIMPDVIDLSNPFQISSSLPSAPITSEAAPELLTSDPILGLPATFDWKAQGKTTAVRDQGSCGSCWAFGTVGAMESAILIQSGQAVDLSEQFLVSCNASGWSCGGGWWAHNYHKSTLANLQSVAGAVLETDMPYTASNGTCRTITNHPYKLTNWYSIAGNTIPTVNQIKNAISTYGPVAAAICVGPVFSGYHGGVFSTNEASSCSSTVNHAIVLTGWDDATQSWVLRNSWGPNWGEAGYMRIKWGISNVGFAANYVVYTAGATPTPGGPTETNTPVPQAPPNDDVNTPVDMSLVNNVYTGNQNITAATSASDDPVFACVAGKGYKSVWYRYTATQSGSININTTGSEYDTILGVWQGSRGALNSIACNDDVATNQTQSQVNLSVTSGQVYYIEVAGYNASASGLLNITLTYSPAATSTFTPTATFTPTSTRTNTPTRTFTPTITPRPPVGYGTYDERSAEIVYSGNWMAQSVSGNYTNTEKYSGLIGSNARFTFTGENISVIYRGYPSAFGQMEVRIDGSVVATINQNTTTQQKQLRWNSGNLGAGIHTLILTHITGIYVSLDGIIVSGPPTSTPTASNTYTPTKTRTPTPTMTPRQPVGSGTYDERSAEIVYTGSWMAQSVSGNYAGTEKYSNVAGSSARFTFTGENVSVIYRGHPSAFGLMEVKIDGTYFATINQSTTSSPYQNRWSSGSLGAGSHTLVLTHMTGIYVSLDGIIVSGPPTSTPTASNTYTPTKTRTPTSTMTPRQPVGYGTYDERSAEVIYTGSWMAQSVSGNYANTEKYSTVVGSSANFTFSGENIIVIYRGYPSAFGLMEVRIDGSVVATINQNTSTQQKQLRWNSGNLGAGTHTLILTHMTGPYISLDGIIVNAPPTATPTTRPTAIGCSLLPANNIWNTRVDSLPTAVSSNAYISSIGSTITFHPDFGSGTWNGAPIGIPYNVISSPVTPSTVSFDYADESDTGPYPIPANPLIEGGISSTGDRHILVWDTGACKLYELYSAYSQGNNSWQAGSGAIYDLRSNLLRPAGWTSADAAGLPILPGLVRYEEILSGEITHTIRFTAALTRNQYVWPARHQAGSSSSTSVPPMGQVFRLKANFDISGYPPEIQIIFTAFKRYGIILADNGSNWYVSGAPDERWNNQMLLDAFSTLQGSYFEAVDTSSLMASADSGQVR